MDEQKKSNFIWDAIDADLESGVYDYVQTRFPPEPNGYLHLGHVKAVSINFGTAKKYNGICNLRFDDTNPVKEDISFAHSIEEDIRWLGFDIANVYNASDYFDFLYECATNLIKMGKAFVCDLTSDEIRETRGTFTESGVNSPYRDRSVEENLRLFTEMRDGKYLNGEKVLRAKIDMSSPNITMRDPVIYRILHVPHHNAGDKWCIYPMYDFAHCLSDAKEGVTHSTCSIEFDNNRPLYDWFLNTLDLSHKSRQIEFGRLNINYTLTSKRKCLRLIENNKVTGWDDPRMATIRGMRRRGYTKESIHNFLDSIGTSRAYSVVDYAMLEASLRDDLNQNADRSMAVLDPIKLIIDNYDSTKSEMIEVDINPNKLELGTRAVSFSYELYIESTDFSEDPPKGYFRLSIGREVRLKSAYYVTPTHVDKDENGKILAIHCTYDPESFGGDTADKRKVKGTIQWVDAHTAINAEVRIYDRLFLIENPTVDIPGKDLFDHLNPDSLIALNNCKVEPYLSKCKAEDKFQFMRLGYFTIDKDTTPEKLVINRTVALKDSFTKNK